MWKTIANIVGGIIAGAVGGFFIGKKVSEKRKNLEINKLEEAFREELKDRSRKSCNKPDISEFIVDKEENDIKKDCEDKNSEKIEYYNEKDTLNELTKKYVEEGVATVKPTSKDINVISEDEYYESTDFVRQELTYYADRYLINDRNRVIAKPEDTIGKQAVDILDSGEKSIVYVKDENKSAVYQIFYDSQYWIDLDGDDSDVGYFADEVNNE